MPTALRSSEYPRGLPELPAPLRGQVQQANVLIDNRARIMCMSARLDIRVGEEKPHTSILWWFPSRQRLMKRWPAPYVDFCAGGDPCRKRTRLLFDDDHLSLNVGRRPQWGLNTGSRAPFNGTYNGTTEPHFGAMATSSGHRKREPKGNHT